MPAVLDPVRIEQPRLGGGGSTGFNAQLVVLNDNHNTFDHVIATFCQVIPAMNADKAEGLAWEIHQTGQATVWSGNREAAELYVQQLTAARLRADLR